MTWLRSHIRRWIATSLLLVSGVAFAGEKHAATGLLIRIDRTHKQVEISCREIPGYMAAMEMPFFVRDIKDVESLSPGTTLDFDVVEEKGQPFIENIRVHEFQSMELDPTAALRLKGVEAAMAGKDATPAVKVGETVPDFELVDESNRPLRLSQFDGKAVAVTFMYTRCPFPNYCVRLSNNFSRLQKRFREQIGKELVLLNVVIDTGHDQPHVLANYAAQWRADPKGWHFATGSQEQVQKVCRYFDMNYYPDEGLYIHSFHTALLDRNHKLVANLEGNEFTAKQLGDLVETTLHQQRQH